MRADKFFAEKFGSRTKAADAIERGLVLINGKRVSPSFDVKESDKIEFIEGEENYVSRGGFKLSKALRDFDFDPTDKIFADIGASNGGFTDCLLKHGAKKVYCIDVGESQLDESLKDKNVVILDNFNARNLTKDVFAEELDGVVIDVSFISLTYILGAVSSVLNDGKCVLALIKPQFECDEKIKFKGGIVNDKKVHLSVIKKIYDFALSCNLAPINLTNAPEVKGKNLEYIIHLTKNSKAEELDKLIAKVKL